MGENNEERARVAALYERDLEHEPIEHLENRHPAITLSWDEVADLAAIIERVARLNIGTKTTGSILREAAQAMVNRMRVLLVENTED